ncbi:MAG TPA: HEPN domain-containing protein [Candidatus Wunengus sp. YC65]|uniref:HEPN domain-containing protein n=1 Tax=Candidatus Wunengus sp. YC65 TaxID=3367701 RepID=UPI00402826C8
MTDKERVKKVAAAYLIESRSDRAAVSALIKSKQYNLAIYHAQQSVEKILKACLAAEGKIGIYKHEIFSFFKEAIGDRFKEDEMKILTENIPELEEEWSATRYPGWENAQIWVPSEEYTVDDARDMKRRMEASSRILRKFLKEKHRIKLR